MRSQVLAGYTGTVAADGFAVYEVLTRNGPGLMLAHCWAHAKRKYDDIATTWPVACAEIGTLTGPIYAIERLVPSPFPGDAVAQPLRHYLRNDRSRPVLDRIWSWATQQVGLPRSDFGKAVRYTCWNWWRGLTRSVSDPRIPVGNNAAEHALRGPRRGLTIPAIPGLSRDRSATRRFNLVCSWRSCFRSHTLLGCSLPYLIVPQRDPAFAQGWQGPLTAGSQASARPPRPPTRFVRNGSTNAGRSHSQAG